MPIRPTRGRSRMWAIPSTIVQNTIGPTSIRISLTKPSPSGLSATPVSGEKVPTSTPASTATRTQKNRARGSRGTARASVDRLHRLDQLIDRALRLAVQHAGVVEVEERV